MRNAVLTTKRFVCAVRAVVLAVAPLHACNALPVAALVLPSSASGPTFVYRRTVAVQLVGAITTVVASIADLLVVNAERVGQVWATELLVRALRA